MSRPGVVSFLSRIFVGCSFFLNVFYLFSLASWQIWISDKTHSILASAFSWAAGLLCVILLVRYLWKGMDHRSTYFELCCFSGVEFVQVVFWTICNLSEVTLELGATIPYYLLWVHLALFLLGVTSTYLGKSKTSQTSPT